MRKQHIALAAGAATLAAAVALNFTAPASPPLLPDPKLTPGDVLPGVTLEMIRKPNYSARVRNVPDSEKAAVFAEYGIRNPQRGAWEIDHRVPLCLGGSNAQSNLWSESYLTKPWNAHVKDRLEDHVLVEVRNGRMSLAAGQAVFLAPDWTVEYQRILGSPQGAAARVPGSERD